MSVQVIDDRGVAVRLTQPPRRIVSLVPSTTETLFDLGLGDAVVGRTRFCVHPAARLAQIPKIGGTKNIERERIAALEPDLIVGNCEENTREIFEELADVAPLYAAFPRGVDDALADLLRLGQLTGTVDRAEHWHREVIAARQRLHAVVEAQLRVAYLIWRDPWMAVSSDTFISAMLSEAGLVNVFADHEERFPAFEPDDLVARCPDLVLLSSEPFPFKARHAHELHELGLEPTVSIRAVDGEMLSWHGTRMAQGFDWLTQALVSGWPTL